MFVYENFKTAKKKISEKKSEDMLDVTISNVI